MEKKRCPYCGAELEETQYKGVYYCPICDMKFVENENGEMEELVDE